MVSIAVDLVCTHTMPGDLMERIALHTVLQEGKEIEYYRRLQRR